MFVMCLYFAEVLENCTVGINDYSKCSGKNNWHYNHKVICFKRLLHFRLDTCIIHTTYTL